MAVFDYELKNDLITKYVSVTLSNSYNYTTKYNLQGVQVTMRCGYNTRNKSRWIILMDKNGDLLLSQTFIKYGKRCELNFNSNEKNLNYYVTLKVKDVNKKFADDYDYLGWAKDFDLCFVGYEYSIEERLESNIRNNLVGN